MSDALLARVASYYSHKLAMHGATPSGVDWSSGESQQIRFRQLARLCDEPGRFSFLDYGCGYGAFVDFLQRDGKLGAYTGYDIATEMVAAADALHRRPDCRFTSRREELEPADFTIASGIFNVKLEIESDVWAKYVVRTIEDLAALSRRGFAFNMLSLYSDPERRRGDLYYADPCAMFDLCKRRFSRFVALLHDYPLWEFTILVRLGEPAR